MHGICHFEIPSSDLEKSKRFYSELFGWQFAPQFEPDYLMFSTPEGPGGGIEKADVLKNADVKIYIEVEDIPSVLARAKELGGSVVKEKTLISEEYGSYAMLADSSGVKIGVWAKS
jgi:hypothetical protein